MNTFDKGHVFRQLHESSELFVMPNPWDKGTTRIFSQCGFKALATTSGGLAYSLGKKDGLGVTRKEALQHCEDVVSATSLPVSADLENGYGDSPNEVSGLILEAAKTGIACMELTPSSNACKPIEKPALTWCLRLPSKN